MIIGGSVAVVDADVAVVVSWTSRTRQVAVNAINLTNQVPPDDIPLTPKKNPQRSGSCFMDITMWQGASQELEMSRSLSFV